MPPRPDALPHDPDSAAPAAPDAAAGIYLHVPFCAHICPYCDFNTFSGQDSLIPRYVDALVREIGNRGGQLADRRVATVFFGGGTPSLLDAGSVSRILSACRAACTLAPDAEVTLEANPNGLDARYLSDLREAGVNRLSLGGQTLHRRGLRVLGRLHEADDLRAAAQAARQAGFDNLSVDLIFGWPGQRVDDWRADLDQVLGGTLGTVPEHLSLYSLIVEPGTPMADAVARGILAVPNDDATADMYELAIERLAAANWHHYEVANWAASPAHRSRHNLLYWRNGDYLGCGAGAHGHIAGDRWMNHPSPLAFARSVESGELPTATVERIGPETAMGETMMLGLRLLEQGVERPAFRARHGADLGAAFPRQITRLTELGLLQDSGSALRLTQRGLMVANDVCSEFLP